MVTSSNCGCKIQEGQQTCPYCGAAVKRITRTGNTGRIDQREKARSSNKVLSSRSAAERTVKMYDDSEVTQMMNRAQRKRVLLQIADEMRQAYVQRLIIIALLTGNLVFDLLLLIVSMGH